MTTLKVLWQKVTGSNNTRNVDSVNNKNISSVILINLLLALASLGKDILLAWYLGTSAQADAFLLAYFVIDTIGNNLLASALGVAIIPVLSGLNERGENQRLNNVTRLLVVYTLVISVALSLLIFGMRHGVLSWVGAGLGGPSRQLSTELLSLLIPSIIVFPLINIGVSIMQVHNRFIIPAFAPVLFNIVFLIGLTYLLFDKIPLSIGVYGIALVIMVGLFLMLSLVWIPILKYRLVALPSLRSINTFLGDQPYEITKQRFLFWSSDLVDVWKNFLPYLLTILFPQIIYLVERYMASHLETGSISGLNYAFRLVQFPIWVFIAALSTVLFPVMAKLLAMGDREGFNKILMNSIYSTSVFTIPLCIILFVLRVPIITILLQRGEFSSHSVVITANIMVGYTLAIVFQGFSLILVRAFLVEGRVSYALFAAAVSAIMTISFDFVLVPLVGAIGLGYGAAIGSLINFTMLYMLLSRSIRLHFSPWRKLSKITLANIPLLLSTVIFSQLWILVVENRTFIFKVGYAVVVILVCIPVYWLSLRFFRVELFEKEM